MIIFKKVIKYSNQINRELIFGNQSDYDLDILKRRQKLLNDIKTFMLSYSWVKQRVAKDKLACFIENDFDYKVVSAKFNVSYESARASISLLGKQFEKEIGEGVLDRLMNGNIGLVEADVVGSISSYKGLLVSDLRPLLPKGEIDNSINLLDCRKEISLLQYFTLRRLNEGFNRLDIHKLSHIIAILEDDTDSYSFEKEILMGYLSGDVKKWEYVEKLLEEILHYGR